MGPECFRQKSQREAARKIYVFLFVCVEGQQIDVKISQDSESLFGIAFKTVLKMLSLLVVISRKKNIEKHGFFSFTLFDSGTK